MGNRDKRVLEWTQGPLTLKVRNTGRTIEAGIMQNGKILYYQNGFTSWAGAVNEVNNVARFLAPK